MPASAERAAFVQEEYRSAVWTSDTVKDWYGKVARDTKDQPFQGYFDNIADAQLYVDERGALLGGHARRFRVVVDGILSADIDLSQHVPGVRIIDSELACDMLAAVVAIESVDFEAERTTLNLWGIIGEAP